MFRFFFLLGGRGGGGVPGFWGVLGCSGVPGNNICPKAWLFKSQLMLIPD